MEAIVAISVDEGRPGDIWRLRADDQLVLVQKRNKALIGFQPVAYPAGPTYGIGSSDWGHTLQRFREDLETIFVGDTAHVYVPETDVYIVEIARNPYRASGKGWVAWRTRQPPTWEFSEYGMYFDPSSEWNLDGKLLYRPFAMLHDGEQVTDSDGRHWTFHAPFWFTDADDEDGQRGSPAWPLTLARLWPLPNDGHRTAQVNDTSEDREKKEWAKRAGVGPEVFDLELPDW
jgi:hypothetical protein